MCGFWIELAVLKSQSLLGGSGVGISGDISPPIWAISIVTLGRGSFVSLAGIEGLVKDLAGISSLHPSPYIP